MGLDYDPWRHAEGLRLMVEEHRLAGRRRGEYRHSERLIVLAPGMSHREARSTLAHEIQHAVAGDLPTPFGPVHRRQEIRARRGAAHLLIDADEYAEAEKLRDGHVRSIAADLEVTWRIVADWQTYCASELPRSSSALRAMLRSACW
jgi:Zn-dependent peptidase ImmA (M78 family)